MLVFYLLNLSFQQFDYYVSWHVFSSSFSCLGLIELDCEFSILIKFGKFSSIIFSNAVFSLYLIFSIFFPFVFHLESSYCYVFNSLIFSSPMSNLLLIPFHVFFPLQIQFHLSRHITFYITSIYFLIMVMILCS